MNLVSLHATHQAVALPDLERLAALASSPEAAKGLLRELVAGGAVDEAAVLSTCNRFEIYLACADPASAHASAFTLLSQRLSGGIPAGFAVKRGLDSAEHLLRVASGLESLIVGEDQVLGQVREAYTVAQEAGTAGHDLGLLFERALATGKKVRAKTAVNRGAVSVGSASVDLAERILGSLEGKRVLVVGAGEMAELVAKSLAGRGVVATVVAHRNAEAASALARTLGGDSVPFAELASRLHASDVVITATAAPEPIVTRPMVGGLGRALLFVDIANPRNVARDVAEVPGVRVEDLDGLRRIAEENLARRRKEAESASAIVAEDARRIAAKFESRSAENAMARLQTRAKRIREEELAKALRKLDLDDAERRVVADLVQSAVKRALAEPVDALRDAARRGDEDTVRAVREAFRLDAEAPPPRRAAVRPRRRRGE